MLLFFLLWQMFFNRPPNSFFLFLIMLFERWSGSLSGKYENHRQRIFCFMFVEIGLVVKEVKIENKLQKERHPWQTTHDKENPILIAWIHTIFLSWSERKTWPHLLLHLGTQQQVFGMFHIMTCSLPHPPEAGSSKLLQT